MRQKLSHRHHAIIHHFVKNNMIVTDIATVGSNYEVSGYKIKDTIEQFEPFQAVLTREEATAMLEGKK